MYRWGRRVSVVLGGALCALGGLVAVGRDDTAVAASPAGRMGPFQVRPFSKVPPLGVGAPPRSYGVAAKAIKSGIERRSGRRPPRLSAKERLASRRRYRAVEGAKALSLAQRSFPGELAQPVFDVTDPPEGKLVGTLGSYGALVAMDGGERQMMVSSAPVRQTAGDGGDPVDLSLERSGSEYRSDEPLVDTRFSREAQDGVKFPDAGVSVGVESTQDDAPLVSDDRLFFSEVRTRQRRCLYAASARRPADAAVAQRGEPGVLPARSGSAQGCAVT